MKPQNPKFVITFLFALFLAPLLLAVLMRSGWWDYEPPGSANRGALIEPPVPLPLDSLEQQAPAPGNAPAGDTRKWVMLYPLPASCDASCESDITSLRQIHRATGRHRHRVSIWLLSPRPLDADELDHLIGLYPEFVVMVDRYGDAGRELANAMPPETDTAEAGRGGQTFLLDPAANIILAYDAGFDPGDVDRDLERLLKWSQQE